MYHVIATGLDTSQKQLMFIAGSTPDARRQVRVPLAALQDGRLSLRTDLMDAHLYIFHKRTFFKALEARPNYESLRQVVITSMLILMTSVIAFGVMTTQSKDTSSDPNAEVSPVSRGCKACMHDSSVRSSC